MNHTLNTNNFKQSHKRIQSAQVPRNIVPSKLYDQTRFNYIIKQAEELKEFEFNDNNPALAAYGEEENTYYGNNQFQSPQRQNLTQGIQRPFTAASRIVGVYDYTARHFPSICENKLNFSNRSKMHQKQKFGQRSKTQSLIQQSNEWQKQNQHKFKTQQQNIKEEEEEQQQEKLDENEENQFVQHIGFKLWKKIETDHEQFYRFQSKFKNKPVEVNFYPLKMQISENQFSYMTIKDLAKLIRYPKETLKDFFKEFLVQDEKTGQVLFEVDAFAEYYENANDQDEEGEYDDFIEEFNVTFPYISVYVESLQENFIINLKKTQILEIIESGFQKLKDFAESQFIENVYQQQGLINEEQVEEYENFDQQQKYEDNSQQNQSQNKDNYAEQDMQEQSQENEKSLESVNELDQIEVIIKEETRKGQVYKKLSINFPDSYELEENIHLVQRAVQNGILQKEEGVIEIDSEQYHMVVEPPKIVLTNRNDLKKSVKTLTEKQLTDIEKTKKCLNFEDEDESEDVQKFVADFCNKLSQFQLSKEGQGIYKKIGYEKTTSTPLAERISIKKILEKEGYESNLENQMKMFKIIGKFQWDFKKYTTFFENCKAHFIVNNQELYFDYSKQIQKGDIIPNVPINQKLKIMDCETNCRRYTDLETRKKRALQFQEVTKQPYELYYDNEQDEFNNKFYSWPDLQYLVKEDGKLLYKQSGSSLKAGYADIDICNVIDYLYHSQKNGRNLSLEEDIFNMEDSYYQFVYEEGVDEKKFYSIQEEEIQGYEGEIEVLQEQKA
ncbi:hypothetical protein PPERSA_02454 [Pseudocohnilembus persalinus]|uniref:Uncharacterized protein n=1 Tax=Pseudocohnilembus persalinus TaxID=266149 RepID=A0A0V0QAU2_PSEPJ|nr:hypothetical protein PPERSA_02454 [Pseudocohnilembus persalinus]|eukprot:KRW99342.1 hypothetical protein PPERSA_02454 [Pseudocohnilembus persalinus]